MKSFFDDFDHELPQSLKDVANCIVPPDKNQVWSDVSREIEDFNKKKKLPIFRKLAAIAAILTVLLTGLFAMGDFAFADFKFFQAIKSVFTNVVSITGVTQTSNDMPIIDNNNVGVNSSYKDLYSLEEAGSLLDYEIAVPSYIPSNYTLVGVFIRGIDRLSPVELHYVDSTGNKLIIDEHSIDQTTSFSYNYRSNDAKATTIEFNEYEATLIYFEKTDLRKLLWQTSNRYYIISGRLSEEDIVKVANSLSK